MDYARRLVLGLATLAALAFVPKLAAAQQTPEDQDAYETGAAQPEEPVTTRQTTVGEGTPAEALPPPQNDEDAQPPVAAPAVAYTGVTQQAGVGGTQAYGRAGVLELGGQIAFNKAADFTQLEISPSLGWFFMDNVELSGIVGVHYINAQGVDSTYLTVLAEPSLHIPFSETLFAFFGCGMGLGYASGPGAGFAIAPRLGMNILVGRSGVLTPQVNVAYSTTEAVQTPQGTLLAVNASYGFGAGYTVMW